MAFGLFFSLLVCTTRHVSAFNKSLELNSFRPFFFCFRFARITSPIIDGHM